MSSSPTLTSLHSANLIQILRRANFQYSCIASIVRASIHPTHHARKRATALRLTICIQKALNLDQKQISTIPLPVLDKLATPPLYSCVSLTPDSPTWAQRSQSVTSRWSMTTTDADSDVARELPEGIAITYSPEDTVLYSPTEDSESLRFRVEPAPQLNPSYANDSNKFARHLDIPVDVIRPLSWCPDISSMGPLTRGSASTSTRRPAAPVSSSRIYIHHLTQVTS